MKNFKVIGLMSGTSLDGIDGALITTDGEGFITRQGFLSVPYDDGLRARIRACLNVDIDKSRLVKEVEWDLTVAHAEVVKHLLAKLNLESKDVDLIGFHGQTIAHAPEKKYTCQLGDGALLAKLTGIPVVNDFRTADVKAGGQGAPLVPVYHQALAHDRQKPVAFLNIGGVANVTFVGSMGEVIAFDTGPGNALLDDWMLKRGGQKYDAGGKTAARGKIDENILKQLLAHKFFLAQPPKSLDRNAFAADVYDKLSLEDGAATLAAFTADSIAKSLSHLPAKPQLWVVSGGGRLNDFIMKRLESVVKAPVVSIDTLGLNGDAIEAEAFAYLAVRSFNGLPISFPATTGVPQPMVGGKLNMIPDAA